MSPVFMSLPKHKSFKAATYSARTCSQNYRARAVRTKLRHFVLAALARQFSLRVVDILRAELCSRAVTENYCVIGQFEVGVVN